MMKSSIIVGTILAAIASVSAAPAENGPVSEVVTIGGNTYEGMATVSQVLSVYTFDIQRLTIYSS